MGTIVKAIVTLCVALLLPACVKSQSLGVSCVVCNYTVLSLLGQVTPLQGEPGCAESPASQITTFEEDCAACVSVSVHYTIEYQGVKGMANSTFRGCTSDWEADEHEVCYEDTSLTEDSVNSALEAFNISTSDWSGYQCFCNDEDNCNVNLNNQAQLECIKCSYSKSKKIRKQLGDDKNADCEKNPDAIEERESCSAGQQCAFTVMNVNSFHGTPANSAKLVARGCASVDEDVDDCDDAQDHQEALEDMLGGGEIDIDSGDVCFCDSDDCNDMTSTETGGGEKVSCVLCTAAKGSRSKKQKKKTNQIKDLLDNTDVNCINDAGSLDVVQCEEGEVCTAVAINTTLFNGIDVKPNSLYSRGCIPRGEIGDAEMGMCYHGDDLQDVMDEMFDSLSFTFEGSSVCFCDSDGCNTWDKNSMTSSRGQGTTVTTTTQGTPGDCIDECPEGDQGFHTICGTDCKEGIDCATENMKICKRGKKYDSTTHTCSKDVECAEA